MMCEATRITDKEEQANGIPTMKSQDLVVDWRLINRRRRCHKRATGLLRVKEVQKERDT
jgi:hypothetical protein